MPVLQLDCALLGSRDSVLFLFCTVAPNLAHSSLLNKYLLFASYLIQEIYNGNKCLFNKFIQHDFGSAFYFHCFLTFYVKCEVPGLALI